MRTTLKEIKNKIRNYGVTDITNLAPHDVNELLRSGHFERVFYSSGVYGLNGLIIENIATGEKYACTARNTNLFIMA